MTLARGSTLPRPSLLGRLRRALEALHLLLSYAADRPTRKALISCYRSLLDSPNSVREVSLVLRIRGRRYPFRMRQSDIFTLAEVLHGGQYRIRSSLPGSPVILDAGANIGVSAVWFAAHHPGCTIHCFEPERENFRLLQANLGGLSDCILNRCAVGAEEGQVALRVAEHGALHTTREGAEGSGVQQVPLIALGRYLEERELARVDLLKLDVEGSELEALHGFGERIRSVAVIVGELHRDAVDAAAFRDFLDRSGFRTVWTRDLASQGDGDVQLFEVRREEAELTAGDDQERGAGDRTAR